MAVEAAVVGVEDTRAQTGEMDLGDALQLAGYWRVGVLDGGRIALGGLVQNVRAPEGVEPRLPEEVHDGAASDGRGVEPLVPVHNALPLLPVRDAGHQPVAVQVLDACHRHSRQREGAEHAGTHADCCDDVLLVGVQLARYAAEPSLRAEGVRLARVPDIHRPEV